MLEVYVKSIKDKQGWGQGTWEVAILNRVHLKRWHRSDASRKIRVPGMWHPGKAKAQGTTEGVRVEGAEWTKRWGWRRRDTGRAGRAWRVTHRFQPKWHTHSFKKKNYGVAGYITNNLYFLLLFKNMTIRPHRGCIPTRLALNRGPWHKAGRGSHSPQLPATTVTFLWPSSLITALQLPKPSSDLIPLSEI